MGIYIPGMEMPTRCADCKMYVEDIYCCHLLHREIENPWADDGVELDCPLVPVPKHGRLIDADALDYFKDDSGIAIFDFVTRGQICAAPTILPAGEGET